MRHIHNIRSKFSLLLLVLCCCAFTHAQQAQIPDFALYDQNGMFHQLSRFQENALVLILIQSNGNSVSRNGLKEIATLATLYNEKNLEVFGLNSSDQSRDEIRKELDSLAIEVPILVDSAGIVAKTLRANTPGEAFLIRPSELTLLYRGNVNMLSASENESLLLENTLIQAIVGKVTETASLLDSSESVVNPKNTVTSSEGTISYQNDIAPIFQKRCVTCHVEDGLAPWAMSSHRMIQGWSPMIREVLLTRRMPPGQIDMEVGHWRDNHFISDSEIALLVDWIDKGAKKSVSDSDPLSIAIPVSKVWPHGTPDLVITLPEITVPATGAVDFKYTCVDLALEEDRWISAVSYSIGELSVLHSLVVNATLESTHNSLEGSDPMAGSEFLSLYVPGRTADEFPENSGFLLKKGANLIVKSRYLSSGRETSDITQLGFYFLKSQPEYSLHSLTLENTDFLVPANDANYQVDTYSIALSEDAILESISPLMHSRGKRISIEKILKNGLRETIFNMPNYNYNWQMTYRLAEPMNLQAGTILHATTVYDNSLANPFNLAPDSATTKGPTDNDETLTHYFRLLKKSN